MANIIIFIETTMATDDGDQLEYACLARCSTMNVQNPTIRFNALQSADSTAGVINGAIRDAGIAAAALEGFVVGPSDKKIIIGGAIAV
jgi:hypothetical protein